MTTELQIKECGIDRSIDLVRELSIFVLQNWKVIFLGATRLGCAIPADHYAPQRVQIGNTRLHQGQGWLGTSWDGSPYVPPRGHGVKYADGWKYDGLVGPTDKQIHQTVADIQRLIDAGAEDVGSKLTIQVHNH